ncbi:uncharacterized protein H6S33_003689 [Morchella sextelata]|uniref:uncharacterized protein n=1 Tax=Morchella sextelata TaxID=1174677 RepID=UPI001D038885|nr:uncharacterized protein H6S33_003689 [Morchella sextelata]KAH0606855.1 hypothetical protein H6S33_003689 [Morchella sextelata]
MAPQFFTIPFTSYTPTSAWTSFLSHLAQPHLTRSPLRLIPQPISSRDAADKHFWTTLYTAKATPTDISSPARAHLRDWKCTLTLPTALSLLADHGTLMVFIGPNWSGAERRAAQRTGGCGRVGWHCFVAFWRDGVWGVYDPSFAGAGRGLAGMEGLRLFRYMLEEMREDGLVVDEVWVGGGGNSDGECSEMSRRWVQEEVVSKMGVELGRWEGREGWVRVYDI